MKAHSCFVFSLLAIAGIGTITSGSAQERQMGGAGITVFTDMFDRK